MVRYQKMLAATRNDAGQAWVHADLRRSHAVYPHVSGDGGPYGNHTHIISGWTHLSTANAGKEQPKEIFLCPPYLAHRACHGSKQRTGELVQRPLSSVKPVPHTSRTHASAFLYRWWAFRPPSTSLADWHKTCGVAEESSGRASHAIRSDCPFAALRTCASPVLGCC